MEKSTRMRNRTTNNLRLKAASLYFLNDISNIDQCDKTLLNWRDGYTFNPAIIGRGHFSKVYKVKCCSTGNTLAIKVVRRKRMGTDKIDDIMQEVEFMKMSNKSSNSGFIQLLKVHSSQSDVAIVMEFASGGSLYHVIQELQSGLPDLYSRIILTKILSALNVLHRQDIVHLDIKADNILLRHPYPSTDVVITDFGLARKLSKSKIHKEMIGTPDYIAPEVANFEEICLKSDMWSVGVLTFFLLTNVSPFTGNSKDDTLYKVTKALFDFVGQLNEDHMLTGRSFISSLLIKEPEKRLSAEECLSHNFLSTVPIVECYTERHTLSKVHIELKNEVELRQGTSYQSRGLVTSQYDIDYLHHKHTRMDSVDNLTKGYSADCLDNQEVHESEVVLKNVPNEMETSIYSIDQGIEIFGNDRVEQTRDCMESCIKEMEETEKLISCIRNTSNFRQKQEEEILQEERVEGKLDTNCNKEMEEGENLVNCLRTTSTLTQKEEESLGAERDEDKLDTYCNKEMEEGENLVNCLRTTSTLTQKEEESLGAERDEGKLDTHCIKEMEEGEKLVNCLRTTSTLTQKEEESLGAERDEVKLDTRCIKEMEETEELISCIRNTATLRQKDVERLREDCVEVKLEVKILGSENSIDSIVDDSDASITNIIRSSSSKKETSNAIENLNQKLCHNGNEDESLKENLQPKTHISETNSKGNGNFLRTEIYDSRRRINVIQKSRSNVDKTSVTNISFRNSREDVIDNCDSYERRYTTNPTTTTDSKHFTAGTLRNTNDVIRRRPLSKSIKKNSDKPNGAFDKWNRRSEFIESSSPYMNGGTLNGTQNVSTSIPNLGTLNDSSKKRSTLKASTLFKQKKVSSAPRVKLNCAVS